MGKVIFDLGNEERNELAKGKARGELRSTLESNPRKPILVENGDILDIAENLRLLIEYHKKLGGK